MNTDQSLNMDNVNIEGQMETKMSASGTSSSISSSSASKLAGAGALGGFGGMFSSSLESLKPQEWIVKRRDTLKPWTEFANFARFKKPTSVTQGGARVIKNIEYFQSNYLFVFVFLAIYCVLTSPFLLFAFMAFAGGCYILYLRNKDGNLTVMGRTVSLGQLYSMVGICSIPLFLIAGAGSAVFWIIGASIVVIMLHAGFYSREEQEDPFLAQLNIV